MRNRYIMVFSFLLVLVGCSTDNRIENEEVNNTFGKSDLLLSRMSEVSSKPTANGSLILQSQTYSFGNTVKNVINLDRKEDLRNGRKKSGDEKLNLLTEKGELINIKEVGRTVNDDYADLYGSTVKIISDSELQQNRGEGNTEGEGVYIPELLSSLIVDSEILESGTTVSWNVDSLNENGLLFHITYTPLAQQNIRIAYDNQYRIAEAFVINDAEGSYTIQNDDLDMFPDGARLKVTLMRGAFTVSDVDEDPSFVAFTETSFSSSLKR